MRGLKILAVAFVVIHLLAAVFSPFVYQLVLSWSIHFPNRLNTYLIGKPFPEFYDRIRLLFLLLSVPWMFIQCRLLSATKLGYRSAFPWYSNFLRWYMTGLIWAICVVGLLTFIGVVQFKSSLSFWALFAGLLSAFISAVIIGSMEEPIFRSLFFRMFYTAFTPAVSLVLSAMFFAYMHFKQPHGLWDYNTPPEDVVWLDGLKVAWWVIVGILYNFDLVLFLNLTLVGYTLCLVFMRTKSLWAAIGLHAGWVTSIGWVNKIVVSMDPESFSLWWGSHRVADGYFCSISLLLFAVYLTLFYKPRRPGLTF